MHLSEFEMIVYIIDSFEHYLTCMDNITTSYDEEIAAQKQVEKALYAMSIIWPYLWW